MTTSYSNPAGQGNRCPWVVISQSGLGIAGTLSNLVYASGPPYGNAFWWYSGGAGAYIQFYFGDAVIIDEAVWYQSPAASNGIWKFQGSNDGTNWADIGASFTLGSSATQTITEINGNTTAYKWYRMIIVSGNVSGAPWILGIDFKISWPSVTCSYLNAGGLGDRRSSITMSETIGVQGVLNTLIDGDWLTAGPWFTQSNVTGKYLRFDFGSGAQKIITEVRYRQNLASGNSSTWKWQGSNDGSNWTDIGGSFTMFMLADQIMSSLSGNATGYRYYQLLGISGTIGNQNGFEISFQIGDYVNPLSPDPCKSLSVAAVGTLLGLIQPASSKSLSVAQTSQILGYLVATVCRSLTMAQISGILGLLNADPCRSLTYSAVSEILTLIAIIQQCKSITLSQQALLMGMITNIDLAKSISVLPEGLVKLANPPGNMFLVL